MISDHRERDSLLETLQTLLSVAYITSPRRALISSLRVPISFVVQDSLIRRFYRTCRPAGHRTENSSRREMFSNDLSDSQGPTNLVNDKMKNSTLGDEIDVVSVYACAIRRREAEVGTGVLRVVMHRELPRLASICHPPPTNIARIRRVG